MLANLPKATRWRAMRRGWFWVGYHQRELDIVDNPSPALLALIQRAARKGAMRALRLHDADISPFEPRDLVGEAILRLWQLSARVEQRGERWAVGVATRVASTCIRSMFTYKRMFKFKSFKSVE